MTYGYSMGLALANKQADGKSRGVALGRFCISKGIPVSEVAAAFKVSRTAVYNWFSGASQPDRDHAEQIERFMARRRKK
jgi:transcriptional regulator with XRE-family HTH domain